MGVSNATLVIIAGGLAGGFVNGLTGMGTALTALGIWLHVLPPAIAAPLVVLCSVVGQLQNLPSLWHTIDRHRVAPFIASGIFGVPIGTRLLGLVPVGSLKLLIGGFLIAFCSSMLFANRRLTIRWGGRFADACIGLVGGILGGLAGLSGALPTMWASVRGWSKDERRGVFLAFNLTVLSFAFVSFAVSGFIDEAFFAAALTAVPATIAGAFLGFQVYRRLNDWHFERVVLFLLLASGGSLAWSNW